MGRRACGCLCLVVALGVVGCEAGTSVGPPPPDGVAVEGEFGADYEASVLPLLQLRCASCHSEELLAPAFMAGPDDAAVYAAMMEWPNLVAPGEPLASSLVTYGEHDGPAWFPDEEAVVSAWVAAGATSTFAPGGGLQLPGGGYRTTPVPVDAGPVAVDLAPLGFDGATVRFELSPLPATLLISDMRVESDQQTVRVTRPRLVAVVDGEQVANLEDPFVDLEVVVAPGRVVSLATSLSWVGFPDGASIEVHFEQLQSL